MRASLLASAIASRLRCARRLEAFSIHGHKARIAAAGRRSMTTWAAWTKRVRRYLLPRLEILPSLVRSPVDSCFGTRPSHAAKSRPCLKPFGEMLSEPHASLVGRALVQDGEAQRLETRRGLRAPQIRIKGCGVRVGRFCGESDR